MLVVRHTVSSGSHRNSWNVANYNSSNLSAMTNLLEGPGPFSYNTQKSILRGQHELLETWPVAVCYGHLRTRAQQLYGWRLPFQQHASPHSWNGFVWSGPPFQENLQMFPKWIQHGVTANLSRTFFHLSARDWSLPHTQTRHPCNKTVVDFYQTNAIWMPPLQS